MPVRPTKRVDLRTRLQQDCDVLICGASFAGLAVARELAGTGTHVLVIDRYGLGERQTSACGIPTLWLKAMGLDSSLCQSFDELIVHTPWRTARWRLPWSFSTFDYRELCALLFDQAGHGHGHTELARATVTGRDNFTVHTDRGDVTAPLIIDGLGWRRVLSGAATIQPPNAKLSRGLEVHPPGTGDDMQLWIDPTYVRAGYGWSFPAHHELRVGVGSFWPTHHVKEPTVRLAADLNLSPVGYQGNWIPHQLRAATEDQIFFVGDSAGQCLPLTAEGIRTALYFGIAAGRELRRVISGDITRETALARYSAFSRAHEWKYRWLLRFQHAVGRLTTTPVITAMTTTMERRRLSHWCFDHYLNIAHPSFVNAVEHDRRRHPARA